MNWLKSLSDDKFFKFLVFVDKKGHVRRLMKSSMEEIISEFERRDFLRPNMKGGLALKVSSYILLMKTTAMTEKKEEEKDFSLSVDDLKDFFEAKIREQSVNPRRKPKRHPLRKFKQHVKKKTYSKEFVKKYMKPDKDVNHVQTVLTMFRGEVGVNDILEDLTVPQKKLFLSNLCVELNKKKIEFTKRKLNDGVIMINESKIKRLKK